VSGNAAARSSRSLASTAVAFALMTLLCVTAACAGTTSALPGGTYASPTYHFKVTYPDGWQANACGSDTNCDQSQPNAPVPLILVITRTGAHNPDQLISSLTIDVMNLQALGGVDKAATALAHDKTLSPLTISGLAGYQDNPTTQWTVSPTPQGVTNSTPQPTATPQQGAINTITHTDYYLIHGSFEYQISADALSGDAQALQTMLQSFTIN
jgi:hypothetical protein